MDTITKTDTLQKFVTAQARGDFITVDTEFERKSTYWPKLCLVQLGGADGEACIDPLAESLDLTPLFEILQDKSILKVFHAARQDLEIFHHLTGQVPAPLFDSQVAAMVCGLGESVSYQKLVEHFLQRQLEKTMRMTDWSRRPLNRKQLAYALADVTHLRDLYPLLKERLETSGRESWLKEEMALLSSPGTYECRPEEAWKRLKIRSRNPKFLNMVQALAAWREREAQTRDMARKHVLKDDTLFQLAASPPGTPEEMESIRGLSNGFSRSRTGNALFEAIKQGLDQPPANAPPPPKREKNMRPPQELVTLLKTLLKIRCAQEDVAQKLVATRDDIEALAREEKDIPALKGWRKEVFGRDAERLMAGEISFFYDPEREEIVLSDQTS